MKDRLDTYASYEDAEVAFAEEYMCCREVRSHWEFFTHGECPKALLTGRIAYDDNFELELARALALYAGAIDRHQADPILGVQLEMNLDTYKELDAPLYPEMVVGDDRVLLTHEFISLADLIATPVCRLPGDHDPKLGELNNMSCLNQFLFLWRYFVNGVHLRFYTDALDGNAELMLSMDIDGDQDSIYVTTDISQVH